MRIVASIAASLTQCAFVYESRRREASLWEADGLQMDVHYFKERCCWGERVDSRSVWFWHHRVLAQLPRFAVRPVHKFSPHSSGRTQKPHPSLSSFPDLEGLSVVCITCSTSPSVESNAFFPLHCIGHNASTLPSIVHYITTARPGHHARPADTDLRSHPTICPLSLIS